MTLILNRPTRRRLLTAAAGAGLGLLAAPFVLRSAAAQSWGAGDPFSLGVASGAPRPDGFVLWTRLAPEPLSSNPQTPGGMHGGDVTVGYEIAADPAMRDIVRRGEATAEQAFAYSVHLDVRGLKPGRPYWYRFTSGDAASRSAAPRPSRRRTPRRIGCVSVSCPALTTSTAIFRPTGTSRTKIPNSCFSSATTSTKPSRRGGRPCAGTPTASRRRRCRPTATAMRNTGSTRTLQRLHAEVPALVTWDDHEVQNDYADKWSEHFDDPNCF